MSGLVYYSDINKISHLKFKWKTGASLKLNYWKSYYKRQDLSAFPLTKDIYHCLKDLFKSTNIGKFVNPGLKDFDSPDYYLGKLSQNVYIRTYTPQT